MAEGWMQGIAAAVAHGNPAAVQEIIRDVRSGLDEQMASETEPTGTVGGGDRNESSGAAGGDVTPESGGGEPSSEAETLEE